MNARKKLNAIYLLLATSAAVFFGILFQSVAVFLCCLIVIVVAFIEDGSIRPNRRRR